MPNLYPGGRRIDRGYGMQETQPWLVKVRFKMRSKARTALISGAGRNMGKQIALTFAREGADLILVSRTGDELNKVAGECEALGVKALPLVADMGRHEEVNRVAQQGFARFGK